MLNINNLLLLLKGSKKETKITGTLNIEENLYGVKNIENNIIGSNSVSNIQTGNFNIYSHIQGEVNSFISKDKIINLNGIKKISSEIQGNITKNLNLIGNKRFLLGLEGYKSFFENKKGNFNIFHNVISYISGFKTNAVIYVHIKINNKFDYYFNKISKYSINNTLNVINNIYLKSIKKLSIILANNISPEVRYIVNNVNIQIHNIIDLSYNEDLIEFESFYRTFRIRGTIDNDINIVDFNKLINLFIEVFYDIDGNININLLKEISIKNGIDFDFLLKLVNEVGLNINNLIDLTVQNGANFSLAKKINILFNMNTTVNLDFLATRLYILNDYNNQTLNTMFNVTMDNLTRIIY